MDVESPKRRMMIQDVQFLLLLTMCVFIWWAVSHRSAPSIAVERAMANIDTTLSEIRVVQDYQLLADQRLLSLAEANQELLARIDSCCCVPHKSGRTAVESIPNPLGVGAGPALFVPFIDRTGQIRRIQVAHAKR